MERMRVTSGKGVVQAPQYVSTSEDNVVYVHVVLGSSYGKIEEIEEYQKEMVDLEIKKHPTLTIKAQSNAFLITPEERVIPVPTSPNTRSSTMFYVKTKPQFDSGVHKLIFEFYQFGRLLGMANFDLQIADKSKGQIEFIAPLEIKVPV